MDFQLLALNTRIPPLATGHIARPALAGAIDRALADSRFVLVSAPAGYGKTSLLIEWAHVTARRIAWLTVEPDADEPVRLLRYLVEAWSAADDRVRRSPAGLMLETNQAEADLVVRALANHAVLDAVELTFVFDDLHHVGNPATCETLMFLIEHLPPGARFVASCRGEVRLPRSRLRVRHHLTEIDADRLAFGPRETEALFAQQGAADLSGAELAHVQEQFQGWAAGLQLAARARQRTELGPEAGAEGERVARAFLVDEVVSALEPEARDFLVQCSVLDQLSPVLCDAVTQRADSAAMLDMLERANVFVQRLGGDEPWYRVHPLLRAALQEALHGRPELDVPALHARAGRWMFEQHLVDAAFRHAVAGADRQLAAEIAEAFAVSKLESGDFRAVAHWMEQVPRTWYDECPELQILRMTFTVFSGDIDGGLRIIDELDARWGSRGDRVSERFSAKLAVGRCAIACFLDEIEQAEAAAAIAFRDLDPADVMFRSNTHHALADTYRRNGRWDDARRHYLQVLTYDSDPAFLHRAAHVYGALADLEGRRGRFRDAARYWERDIAAILDRESAGTVPFPIVGWAYIRHAEILFEWNRINEARGELERGLERAELGGDAHALIAGYVLTARMLLAHGNPSRAEGYLDRADVLLERTPYPEWRSRADRVRALWLAQTQSAALARRWWRHIEREGGLAGRPDNQEAYLGLAHLLVVFGDEADRRRARDLLDGLQDRARQEDRLGIQIEALALTALARRRSGNEAGARAMLAQALELAEPEGAIRLFLDLGEPMFDLLRHADRAGDLPAAGHDVLQASLKRQVVPPELDSERLSDREIDILRLVSAGLTNQEVADRLFISPETVKKHLANIYGKLQVHRRMEAVVRARDLGILH